MKKAIRGKDVVVGGLRGRSEKSEMSGMSEKSASEKCSYVRRACSGEPNRAGPAAQAEMKSASHELRLIPPNRAPIRHV